MAQSTRRSARRSNPLPWVIGAIVLLALALIALNLTARRPNPELGGVTAPAVGRADTSNAAQVAAGQAIYVARCASCHGRQLEGQPNWQTQLPDGSRPAPPHDASGHTWHHSDAYLFDVTKRGGQASSPPGYKNAMPGFASVLSDDQIWAVLAYIKSTWPADIQAAQPVR